MTALDRRRLLIGLTATALSGCADPAARPAGDAGPTGGTDAPGVTSALPISSLTLADATTTSSPALAPPSTTSVHTGPAAYVGHGARTRDEVALTFHTNGDPALVTRLADALAAAGVVATMFVVGQWAAEQPAIVQRLVRDGHELANHTWSHPSLVDLDADAMRTEIVRCRDLLAGYPAATARYFRPSAIDVPTEAILRAAGAAGYAVSLGYDVDPLDYTDPGPAAIVSATAAGVQPGSIISLHTGHADTIDALGDLLAMLRSRNLRPVTCSTLLR